jgi:hypothetical protein
VTPEKRALKRATVETLKGVGGVDAAANYCRPGKSQLSDYGNENRPDSFMPLDVIADLEPLARDREGSPHITHLLCQLMGGVFVAVPDTPVTTGRLLETMAALHSEFSQVTQAVCAGLADHDFCALDAARLESELEDVIRVAVTMRAMARSIKGGEQ